MKKTFDCIEMKRQGAARLMMLLDPMSQEEQLVFWQQRTTQLQQLIQQARLNKQQVCDDTQQAIPIHTHG